MIERSKFFYLHFLYYIKNEAQNQNRYTFSCIFSAALIRHAQIKPYNKHTNNNRIFLQKKRILLLPDDAYSPGWTQPPVKCISAQSQYDKTIICLLIFIKHLSTTDFIMNHN